MHTTSAVVEQMQRAHTASLELLRLQDNQRIHDQAQALTTVEATLRDQLEQLSHIIRRGSIDLDVQPILHKHQTFFTHARDAIVAHQAKLTHAAAAQHGFSNFETRRQELDTLLADFYSQSDAEVNSKEDRGKTLVQSGNAAVADLDAILRELFQQDYPLVQGAAKLQRFLVQLQDIARAYLATAEAEQLTAIDKKFERSLKQATAQLKRLQSRAVTEKKTATVQQLLDGFSAIQTIVQGDGGAFALHRHYLQAVAHIQQLETLLAAAANDYQMALEASFKAAEALDLHAQSSANAEVQRARQGIGMIVMVEVALGMLCTVLFPRTITRPLALLNQVARQVAQGDVSMDIAIHKDDEIGRLTASFQTVVESLRAQAAIAQRIAAGDLGVEVHLRSQEDVLARSMAQVVATLRRVRDEIQALVNSARAGRLQERGNTEQFQQDFGARRASTRRSMRSLRRSMKLWIPSNK